DLRPGLHCARLSREGATPETSLPRGRAQGESRARGRRRCHYTFYIKYLCMRTDAGWTGWQGNFDGSKDAWENRADRAILTIQKLLIAEEAVPYRAAPSLWQDGARWRKSDQA